MKRNVKLEALYLTEEARVFFNKAASGSYRGVRFNGSTKDYFLKLFKDNIDHFVVRQDDKKGFVIETFLTIHNPVQKIAFRVWRKTIKGFAKRISNKELGLIISYSEGSP